MMKNMPGALASAQPMDEQYPERSSHNNSDGVGEGPNNETDVAGPDQPTAQHTELFDLVVGRTLEALSQDGEGLDSALKASPIKGAVEYGVAALHTVAGAADKAGKPIPFEVLIGAGMQTIKVLAGIANDKGYLADEDIEGFLKEAFQQSLGNYAQMDMQTGKLDQKTLAQVQQAMGGQAGPSGAAPNQAPMQSPMQGALPAAGGM